MILTTWLRARLRRWRRDGTLVAPMRKPEATTETAAAEAPSFIADAVTKQEAYAARRRAWAAHARAELERTMAARDAAASAQQAKDPDHA